MGYSYICQTYLPNIEKQTKYMYPDLSYLFHDLIGTQPDNWLSIFKTFGFFLVMAVLTAAYFLGLELKRKKEEGHLVARNIKVIRGEGPGVLEIIGNLLYGFVLGFKGGYLVGNFASFQNDPFSALFSMQGNWIAGLLIGGGLAALYYFQKNKTKLPEPKTVIEEQWPHQRVGDLAVVAAVSGVIGAKLFASFESVEAMTQFFNDPIGTFFSGSGLAIYGGLIVGFSTLVWYIRKLKVPFYHFFDALGPAFLFSMAVGRIGCQLSGDGDWGIVADTMPNWWFLPDWLWAYDYPQNVNNAGVLMAEICDPDKYRELMSTRMSMEDRCFEACGIRYCHELDSGVYPTPLYEIMMFTGMGSFLWWLRKKITIPGIIFFLTLMFSGVERYFIEAIRVNDKIQFLGGEWTQAELISVALFFIGFIGAGLLWKNRPKENQPAA